MDDWSSGGTHLPLRRRRDEANRWACEQAGAAVGFVGFPESLEVFTNHFDADLKGGRSGWNRRANSC
jgi:hypothetical protein